MFFPARVSWVTAQATDPSALLLSRTPAAAAWKGTCGLLTGMGEGRGESLVSPSTQSRVGVGRGAAEDEQPEAESEPCLSPTLKGGQSSEKCPQQASPRD